MAAAEAKLYGYRALLGCFLGEFVFSVGGAVLDAADHASDNITQKAADAQSSIFLALLKSRVPFVHTNLIDDGSKLGIVELSRKLRCRPMSISSIDSIHHTNEPRSRINRHTWAVLGHPLPDLAIHVRQLLGVVPAVGGALGKGTGQRGEAATRRIVGEERLVGGGAGDDGRRREVGRACRARVQALEGLLHGLEGARDGRCAEVYGVGVGDVGREEGELIHVEVSQPLSQLIRRLPAAIRQHAKVANGIQLALGPRRDHGDVIRAKGLEAVLPFEGREGLGFRFEDGAAQVADGGAVGPEGGEAGILEAGVDGRTFAVTEEDLDELETELRGVEGGELVGGVWRAGLMGCHDIMIR